MKKRLTAVLASALLVCLSACGEAAAEPGEQELNLQPMVPVEEEIAASESSASAMEHEAPASAANAEPEGGGDQTFIDEVREYIGRPAAELIEFIGEPITSQYAASCEVDGAEDGMLIYDGFSVWTIRTDEEEIVRGVYTDAG